MTAFRLLLLPVFLVVAGCSTPDNSEPPAELTQIDNPIKVKIQWTADTGYGAVNKFIDMQPLVLDGKVYSIDTRGLMSRRDGVNGKEDWSLETGLSASSGLNGDHSRLIATSRDGELELFDYDDKGIKSRWKKQLSGEIRSKAVLSGEQVFVRSVDGKLSALDARNGQLQWAVSRRVPALSLTGNSFPIVTDKLVVGAFDNGKLVALDRENGSTLWEHTVSSPKGKTEIERLVDLDGPFILRDGIIYISSYQGDMVAISLNSGQVLWSRKFSSFQAIDADQESLYVTDDKSHVWSIDRRTGSAFWKQDALNARKLTAPRLTGDKLAVADLEGYIHWLSKSDGRILAREQPNGIRYIAQPLTLDSTLIVMDISGQLTALALTE